MSIISAIKKGIRENKSKNKAAKICFGTINGLFPEFNLFVKVSRNDALGARFWFAMAYHSTNLPETEIKQFVTNNAIGIQLDEVQKSTYSFNSNTLSFARFANPLKPLALGLNILKSKIANGVDKVLLENKYSSDTTGESYGIAKGIKLAIQIALLPIELPIKLGEKIIDIGLDGISAVGKKIKSLFSPNKRVAPQVQELTSSPVEKNNSLEMVEIAKEQEQTIKQEQDGQPKKIQSQNTVSIDSESSADQNTTTHIQQTLENNLSHTTGQIEAKKPTAIQTSAVVETNTEGQKYNMLTQPVFFTLKQTASPKFLELLNASEAASKIKIKSSNSTQ